MKTPADRLQALRAWMRAEGVDAYVVATADPHNSECVAEHWQCRSWLTGFDGSAGTAVVTQREALLWTDSRYWLQAGAQLAGSGFGLMREGEDVSIAEWLSAAAAEQPAGALRVAFPRELMTPELYAELFGPCSPAVEVLSVEADPFDTLWADRPAFPLTPVEVMSEAVAGRSAADKLSAVAAWLTSRGLTELFVADLSAVCWTLNVRAADVPYNPFVIAFLLVRADGHHVLYADARQFGADVRAYLDSLGVSLAPYADGLTRQQASISEPAAESPIEQWRAVKNEAEQQGFREAHVRDGVAMTRLLCWLDRVMGGQSKGAGEQSEPTAEVVTEMTVDRVLTDFRAAQSGFCGLCFETISAYGPHGAIVHYSATPATDARLEPRGLLLLDAGAHYDCGTTDITRTVALGPVTAEERRVYTLVLKGHLQLAHLRFPDGTTGLQLDTAARAAMWREGYDFGHGTGHGVGHRLGAHEGPVQIRKNLRACTTLPFHAGQTITDEPGIYVEGRFGVRIENVLLTADGGTTPFGRFLQFEDLTLCPYDVRPLEVELLTPDERRWLNDYHARVRTVIGPLLDSEEERRWLEQATREV